MWFDLGVSIINKGYNENDSEFRQYTVNLKADEIIIVHRGSVKPTKYRYTFRSNKLDNSIVVNYSFIRKRAVSVRNVN